MDANEKIAALSAQLEQQQKLIETLLARQTELEDRQAIMDCVTAFCRGINRLDRDLLLSSFHPDAVDDHGYFVGNREKFVDYIDMCYQGMSVTEHYIMNHRLELDGSVAHGETYWLAITGRKDGPGVYQWGGRYIDRFEKRAGKWAISERVCLIEWGAAPEAHEIPAENHALLAKSGKSAMDKSDLSYVRPLSLKHREHFTAQAALKKSQISYPSET